MISFFFNLISWFKQRNDGFTEKVTSKKTEEENKKLGDNLSKGSLEVIAEHEGFFIVFRN